MEHSHAANMRGRDPSGWILVTLETPTDNRDERLTGGCPGPPFGRGLLVTSSTQGGSMISAKKVGYAFVRSHVAAQLLLAGHPGTLSIIDDDLIDTYDALNTPPGGLAAVVGSGGVIVQEILTAILAFINSPAGQSLINALVQALIAMLAGGG